MFVEQVFLPEVCASGAVTPRQLSQLRELLHALTVRAGESTAGAAQTPGTAAPTIARSVGPYPTPPSGLAPPQPAHAAEQPTVATSPPAPARPAETPAAPARAPSALSRWWTRTREGVGSDLAVHGLAYLGVLLFFTGAFGLVAFTFADVAPTLRWVSEIVIASAPFISAALLLRRGAVTVGRALEVGGGLLLPVMVITTFLDGVAFPPDLTGAALVATLTACCAAIGAGYALWSGAHPASGLRFLVAPMVWFTVAMATLGLGRAIPVGEAVAIPGSAQITAIAASLVATLVAARWRPRALLAAPTLTAAVTGTLVIGLFAVLTWVAEDWPALPVGATGVLILAALELLRIRLPGAVVNLVEPLWWWLVGLALVADLGLGPSAAVSAAGFVVLVEVAGAACRPAWAVALPAAGAVAGVAAVWAEPWWAVGVLGAASVWVMARRLAPFEVPRAGIGLDVAAALLPLGFVLALGAATDLPTALACGAGLVLLATVPAIRPVLHRDEQDVFWKLWWPAALVAVAAAAALGWVVAASTSQQWLVTISVAALA
ncbi:MAG TPA: hypothetical protein VFC16_02125, partial [Nakamurella sp.]|nr:hypothetical protein [Nakamurella sp.]